MPGPYPFDFVSIPDLLLPHRVDVLACDDSAVDDGGGRKPSYTTARRRAVKCWVQQLSVADAEKYKRLGLDYSHEVLFGEKIPEMEQRDALQFGDRLLIVKTFSDELEEGLSFSALCEEIQL